MMNINEGSSRHPEEDFLVKNVNFENSPLILNKASNLARKEEVNTSIKKLSPTRWLSQDIEMNSEIKKLNSLHFDSIYDYEEHDSNAQTKPDIEKEFRKIELDRYFFLGFLFGLLFNFLAIVCCCVNHKKSFRVGTFCGILLNTIIIILVITLPLVLL